MNKLDKTTVSATVAALLGLILGVLVGATAALAHDDDCDGIQIIDFRTVEWTTYVQYTRIIHVVDDDGEVVMHWQSTPGWMPKREMEAMCGPI